MTLHSADDNRGLIVAIVLLVSVPTGTCIFVREQGRCHPVSLLQALAHHSELFFAVAKPLQIIRIMSATTSKDSLPAPTERATGNSQPINQPL